MEEREAALMQLPMTGEIMIQSLCRGGGLFFTPLAYLMHVVPHV